jgi:hypothetical protein
MKRVTQTEDDFNIIVNYLAKQKINFPTAREATKVMDAIDRAVIMDIQTEKDEV